jgi:hypothetical protein
LSAALFVVLDPQIPGFDPFLNGKTLAKELDALDELALRLGVRALAEFVSMNEGTAMNFLDEGDPIPPAVWFAPEEGLATVRSFRAHLMAEHPHPAVADPARALDDLGDLERILAAASEHGARWHLEVDY